MKKLTKKMKSILIASIAAVCAVAIALGCILGLKGDNNNGGTPSDTSYEQFVQAHNKFASAMGGYNADEILSSSDFSVVQNRELSFAKGKFFVITDSGMQKLYT